MHFDPREHELVERTTDQLSEEFDSVVIVATLHENGATRLFTGFRGNAFTNSGALKYLVDSGCIIDDGGEEQEGDDEE